jgi:hypothetical protein
MTGKDGNTYLYVGREEAKGMIYHFARKQEAKT